MSEKEEAELKDLKFFIESDAFQKHIAKPMREYQKKQERDFFSDDLKTEWRKGGRVEGAEEFFKRLRIITESLS